MTVHAPRILAAALFAAFSVGNVWAQQACPCGTGVRLVAAQIAPLMANKTVCGIAGGNTWQEFHSGSTARGGPVIDWKMGPNHAVDPSKQVATWSVPATRSGSRIVYDYGGGITYRFAVCQVSADTVNLCGEANTTTNLLGAVLRPGQVACSAGNGLPLAASKR